MITWNEWTHIPGTKGKTFISFLEAYQNELCNKILSETFGGF